MAAPTCNGPQQNDRRRHSPPELRFQTPSPAIKSPPTSKGSQPLKKRLIRPSALNVPQPHPESPTPAKRSPPVIKGIAGQNSTKPATAELKRSFNLAVDLLGILDASALSMTASTNKGVATPVPCPPHEEQSTPSESPEQFLPSQQRAPEIAAFRNNSNSNSPSKLNLVEFPEIADVILVKKAYRGHPGNIFYEERLEEQATKLALASDGEQINKVWYIITISILISFTTYILHSSLHTICCCLCCDLLPQVDAAFSLVNSIQAKTQARFLSPSPTKPPMFQEVNLSEAVQSVMEDLSAKIDLIRAKECVNGIHPDVIEKLKEFGDKKSHRSEEDRIQGVLGLLTVPPKLTSEEIEELGLLSQSKQTSQKPRRMSMSAAQQSVGQAVVTKMKKSPRRSSMPVSSSPAVTKPKRVATPPLRPPSAPSLKKPVEVLQTSSSQQREEAVTALRRMPFGYLFSQSKVDMKASIENPAHSKGRALTFSNSRGETLSFPDRACFENSGSEGMFHPDTTMTQFGPSRSVAAFQSKSHLLTEENKVQLAPPPRITTPLSAIRSQCHPDQMMLPRSHTSAPSVHTGEDPNLDGLGLLLPPPPLKRGRSRSLEFITPRSDIRKHAQVTPRKERRHSVAGATSPKPLERKRSTSLPSSRTTSPDVSQEVKQPKPSSSLGSPEFGKMTPSELKDHLSRPK